MISFQRLKLLRSCVFTIYTKTTKNIGFKKHENKINLMKLANLYSKTFSTHNKDIPKNDILEFNVDIYKSAYLTNNKTFPNDLQGFDQSLKNTIDHLISNGFRGIWLKLDISQSNLIHIAVKYGFIFHHAKENYLMMNKWLAQESCKFPKFASHYCGVGGIVINPEKEEILTIQERISLIDSNLYVLSSFSFNSKDLWKIPGGLIEPGEFIGDAARREIKEETGIETEFISIVGLREKKNYRFEQPDIYFITLLKPKTYEIKPDYTEIKIAKWMPIVIFPNESFPILAISTSTQKTWMASSKPLLNK